MWFVVGVDSLARIGETIDDIERATGLDIVNLPKIEEFYAGLKLEA